jgi:hypothetical protein
MRKISFVVLFAMLLSVVSTSDMETRIVYSGSWTYDRDAVCNYAANYWNKVTSDGYFFDVGYPPTKLDAGSLLSEARLNGGEDCSHYVSCAIGNEKNVKGGGVPLPSRTEAYGEPGVERLGNWLLSSKYAESKTSIDDLKKGDVIQYDLPPPDGTWDHSAVYLGDKKISTHSNSRRSEDWDLGGKKRFIHIKDSVNDGGSNTTGGVGGIVVPVDKFGLLAPYIGLASTALVAIVATSAYVKHVKRRKEKQ